jgi:hypothetical protein
LWYFLTAGGALANVYKGWDAAKVSSNKNLSALLRAMREIAEAAPTAGIRQIGERHQKPAASGPGEVLEALHTVRDR